jgi:hypothetical protein
MSSLLSAAWQKSFERQLDSSYSAFHGVEMSQSIVQFTKAWAYKDASPTKIKHTAGKHPWQITGIFFSVYAPVIGLFSVM